MGNVSGLGLIFEHAFELIDDVTQREFPLKAVFTSETIPALGHRLSGGGHLDGSAPGAIAGVMPHSLVIAGETFQTFSQRCGFLAQLIFLLCYLAWRLRLRLRVLGLLLSLRLRV